jgi:hypothetical protein
VPLWCRRTRDGVVDKQTHQVVSRIFFNLLKEARIFKLLKEVGKMYLKEEKWRICFICFMSGRGRGLQPSHHFFLSSFFYFFPFFIFISIILHLSLLFLFFYLVLMFIFVGLRFLSLFYRLMVDFFYDFTSTYINNKWGASLAKKIIYFCAAWVHIHRGFHPLLLIGSQGFCTCDKLFSICDILFFIHSAFFLVSAQVLFFGMGTSIDNFHLFICQFTRFFMQYYVFCLRCSSSM